MDEREKTVQPNLANGPERPEPEDLAAQIEKVKSITSFDEFAKTDFAKMTGSEDETLRPHIEGTVVLINQNDIILASTIAEKFNNLALPIYVGLKLSEARNTLNQDDLDTFIVQLDNLIRQFGVVSIVAGIYVDSFNHYLSLANKMKESIKKAPVEEGISLIRQKIADQANQKIDAFRMNDRRTNIPDGQPQVIERDDGGFFTSTTFDVQSGYVLFALAQRAGYAEFNLPYNFNPDANYPVLQAHLLQSFDREGKPEATYLVASNNYYPVRDEDGAAVGQPIRSKYSHYEGPAYRIKDSDPNQPSSWRPLVTEQGSRVVKDASKVEQDWQEIPTTKIIRTEVGEDTSIQYFSE